jgi:hypothetical protein
MSKEELQEDKDDLFNKYINQELPKTNKYNVALDKVLDLFSLPKDNIDELIKYNAEGNQLKIDFLMFAQKLIYTKFLDFDCRNRIENTRLDTTGTETTKFAIKSEQSVLGKSNSETNTYLVIGGLVILSTLVILLTNKK